jgi:hypothetical protein
MYRSSGRARCAAADGPAQIIQSGRNSTGESRDAVGGNATRQSARRCRGNVKLVSEPHIGEFPRKLPCRTYYRIVGGRNWESWDPYNFRPAAPYFRPAGQASTDHFGIYTAGAGGPRRWPNPARQHPLLQPGSGRLDSGTAIGRGVRRDDRSGRVRFALIQCGQAGAGRGTPALAPEC